MIRKATISDLDTIYKIYDFARSQMAKNGNPKQQCNGYPFKSLLQEDVATERMYVLEDNGTVHGVFVLIVGEDPTYRVIHDGAWHSDKTYATIHRIASDGMVKHCLKTVVDFAKTKVDYVRLDTNEDNKIMQHLAQKCGFKYCGIIYVADGTPRLAYDLLKA